MNNKNHNLQTRNHNSRLPGEGLPHDALDSLLRTWHDENAQRAAQGRAQLFGRLAASRDQGAPTPSISFVAHLRVLLHSRALRAAASLALLITTLAAVISVVHTPANAATRQIMTPEGGRLDAVDSGGNLMGPCALAHTDVKVNVAGPFTRVRVKQDYHNPYNVKIEAVYTFPLSNRAAVDGMTMTIHSPEGDRVVVAESRERQQARQIYENARQAGHVASLLEQERPNIFTQSVANIEPRASITIEISYVEMLQSKDGEYTFDFPMVVAPRYMPGSPLRGSMADERAQLPDGLEHRFGIILKAPASFERVQMQLDAARSGGGGLGGAFTTTPLGAAPLIGEFISAAIAINPPSGEFRMREDNQKLFYARPGIDFYVTYADGTREFGQISGEGLGHIAGRWFWLSPPNFAKFDRNEVGGVNNQSGTGYEPDTTRVPDASRISPRPARPPMRAGHDVSLSVSIDTGGPAIIDYNSDLHEIRCTHGPRYKNLGDKINLSLQNRSEIPNRDFVLRWRTTNENVQEAAFAYLPATGGAVGGTVVSPLKHTEGSTSATFDDARGFFTLVLAPPARVDTDNVMPRELVFVLDTSGSMSGQPLEKAKAVMARAIDAMWPTDTFNFITFSGDTHILWDRPRPNTEANRAEAQQFLASRSGDGGTEMMKAIDAALAPTAPANGSKPLTPAELANLPADGREVRVASAARDFIPLLQDGAAPNVVDIKAGDSLLVRAQITKWTLDHNHFDLESPRIIEMRGRWSTRNGERVLEDVDAVIADDENGVSPLRIVMFLTDGQVGNDEQIIQAVREHAKTSRVFSFGIGDSPNRSLLDGMANAGRGEAEYVNLQNNPDAAVQRFARRIASPVLTDISLTFAPGVTVSDTIPPLDSIPDLFDVKPLIIHGRFAMNGIAAGAGAAGSSGGTGVWPVKTSVTLRGRTAAGPYERAIELDLSAQHGAPRAIGAGRAGGQMGGGAEEDSHRVLATLWARATVEELGKTNTDASQNGKIIGLGERFNIMTPLTSFVAVEKLRLTIQGRTVLVPIPVELPAGQQWEAFFCGTRRQTSGEAAAEIHGIADQLNARTSAIELGSNLMDPTLGKKLRAPGSPTESGGYNGYSSVPHDADGQSAYGLRNHSDIPYAGLPLHQSVEGAAGNQIRFIEGRHTPFITNSNMSVDIPTTGMPQIRRNVAFNLQRADFMDTPTIDLGLSLEQGDQAFTGGGGGFGGGGSGGGGGGGGGGIFGDAGEDPARLSETFAVFSPPSPEIARLQVIDTIQSTIHPEAWKDQGGTLASLTFDKGRFVFQPLTADPQSQTVVEEGRAFLAFMQQNIAVIQPLGTIDAAPRQAFAETATVVIYDIREFKAASGGAIDPKRIADLLMETIDREGWEELGGDSGSIKIVQQNLVIRTTPANHAVIAEFLSLVRIALQPPTAAGGAPNPAGGGEQRLETPVGQVEINAALRTKADQRLVIYDVRDLFGAQSAGLNADAVKQLVDLVTECVEPESWHIYGGDRSDIHELDGTFIITTTDAIHGQIHALLEQLRTATRNANPMPVRVPLASATAGTPPVSAAERVVYWVGDLLVVGSLPNSRAELVKQIVDIIQENVNTEGWRDLGGDVGSLLVWNDCMVISNTPTNQKSIEGVLAELRMLHAATAPQPQAKPSTVSPAPQESSHAREHRVIDQRLWLAAFPTTDDGDSIAVVGTNVSVVVLVADTSEPIIARLKAAGLRVDDVSRPTKVIAGSIAGSKLLDLALVDAVKKIEPLM